MKRTSLLLPTAVACLLVASCHDSKPVPAPAPAPQPEAASQAAPTIKSFSAIPSGIASGASASLSWSVSDSDSVQIDHGIGEVEPFGKRTVAPTATTSYKLTATNLHGSSSATALLTVEGSSSEGANGGAGDVNRTGEILTQRLRDLHFEYNEDVIRHDEEQVLAADAAVLKSLFQSDPSITITIEGHCDERGSPEYNMGLADRRANYVRDSLIKLGVPGDRLTVVSYGDQRPVCLEATEECYGRNRRAHFRLGQ